MYTGHFLMGGANILSPWFSREADNAIFSWEQIQTMGGVTLAVTVWHKNTEEIGQGTGITGAWNTDGAISYKEFSGLKELVRFEFSASTFSNNVVGVVQNPGGTGADVNTLLSETDIGWIMFRMLAPTWFNAANAS